MKTIDYIHKGRRIPVQVYETTTCMQMRTRTIGSDMAYFECGIDIPSEGKWQPICTNVSIFENSFYFLIESYFKYAKAAGFGGDLDLIDLIIFCDDSDVLDIEPTYIDNPRFWSVPVYAGQWIDTNDK